MTRESTEAWHPERACSMVYITLPSVGESSCHHSTPSQLILRLVFEKQHLFLWINASAHHISGAFSIVSIAMSYHQALAATWLLLEIVRVSILCTQLISNHSPRPLPMHWALQSTGFMCTLSARSPDRSILPYLGFHWPLNNISEVFSTRTCCSYIKSTVTLFVLGRTTLP